MSSSAGSPWCDCNSFHTQFYAFSATSTSLHTHIPSQYFTQALVGPGQGLYPFDAISTEDAQEVTFNAELASDRGYPS